PPVPVVTTSPFSVEVLPPVAPQPRRAQRAVYHVHTEDKVRMHDEDELVRLIRNGTLPGLELVRRESEESWRPLFETRVYRLEVPTAGDPRDAARWRALRALGGHFSGFFITLVVMVILTHEFPWWMGIWAAVLLVQTMGSLPAAMRLLQNPRPERHAPLHPRAAVAPAAPH